MCEDGEGSDWTGMTGKDTRIFTIRQSISVMWIATLFLSLHGNVHGEIMNFRDEDGN